MNFWVVTNRAVVIAAHRPSDLRGYKITPGCTTGEPMIVLRRPPARCASPWPLPRSLPVGSRAADCRHRQPDETIRNRSGLIRFAIACAECRAELTFVAVGRFVQINVRKCDQGRHKFQQRRRFCGWTWRVKGTIRVNRKRIPAMDALVSPRTYTGTTSRLTDCA